MKRHITLAPAPAILALLPITLAITLACSDDNVDPATDGGVINKDAPPSQLDSKVGPPVTFTLATWNVKDFFDEKDDPGLSDDVLSNAQVKAKMQKLGSAINALDSDILVLQEVENLSLLKRLNQGYLGKMGYKDVWLQEGNDLRGIDVALLSKFEVTQYLSNAKDTFPGVQDPGKNYGFSRDCPMATIKLGPGRQLRLLINHLRAGGGYTDLRRREAQAQRVRQLADMVLKGDPQANLAVIGDLNDQANSDTLKLVRDKSPNLFAVTSLLPSSQRKTFRGSKQLDYILAAPGLRADLVDSSVTVPFDNLFSGTSDHYPIRAKFNLK